MAEMSKTCTIDMGHRVTNHLSRCRNAHGHTYRIELFAAGPLQKEGPSEGMVVDFSFLKDLLQYIDAIFDHGFAMWIRDEALLKAADIQLNAEVVYEALHRYVAYHSTVFGNVLLVADVPTAENLAAVWLGICRSKAVDMSLPIGVTITRIKVWETPTSCVEVS